MMGIEDLLLSYWFDEVVELFGTQIDILLDVKKKNGKPKYTLDQAISETLKQYRRSRKKYGRGALSDADNDQALTQLESMTHFGVVIEKGSDSKARDS